MADDISIPDPALALSSAREGFVESMGVYFQTEGMPRTAGRMLGLLIFDGTAMSFSELAEKLQVSRGSISTSSRLLMQGGMVRRVSRPGERQDYFQLADKPYEALVTTEIARMKYAQEEIEKSMRSIPACQTETCARLGDLCNFFRTVEGGLRSLLPRLSQKDDGRG